MGGTNVVRGSALAGRVDQGLPEKIHILQVDITAGDGCPDGIPEMPGAHLQGQHSLRDIHVLRAEVLPVVTPDGVPKLYKECKTTITPRTSPFSGRRSCAWRRPW